MANIAIMALGTLGDINPFLCIAKDLSTRGHTVNFITNSYYQQQILAANLNFIPLGSQEKVEATLSNPDLWDNKKSSTLFYKLCIDFAKPGYDAINNLHQSGVDIIISPFQCFGARLANEKLGIPLVTVLPNPIYARSIYSPVVYSVLPWLSNCGSLGARLLYSLVDKGFEKIVNEPVNQIRENLSLPRLDKIKPWVRSPSHVIGLWPSWLNPPQKDWPKTITLAGFLQYDGEALHNVNLPDIINNKPIVVTPGSAMMHAKQTLQATVDASTILNKPILLVTPHKEQLPTLLPDNVSHVPFLPFKQLLHKCSAIVHHGGIGTTARAFSAGIPQLITPMAFDQFDNARLIKNVGVGDSLHQRKINADSVASKLSHLLSSKTVKNNCERIAENVKENNNNHTLEKIYAIIESAIEKR